jgi:hypothetical protein
MISLKLAFCLADMDTSTFFCQISKPSKFITSIMLAAIFVYTMHADLLLIWYLNC